MRAPAPSVIPSQCYERHPGSTVYSGVLSLRDRVVSPSFFDPVTGGAPVMSIGCCTSGGFPTFDPLPGNYDSTTGAWPRARSTILMPP